MKIPKKISPDRIKDAIVEVRYSSSLHFEVIAGMFYQSLDDSYSYTNRPLHKTAPYQQNIATGELTFALGGQSIFYNDKIKIQVLPNSLVFNILNEYISWENYKPEIEKALKQLQKANVIEKFTRIGMRYISEYPNHDLGTCVKFNFTFGMPSVVSDKYLFQTEFQYDGFRVILNLKHNQPVISIREKNQVSVATSTIDIDTISKDFQITDLKQLLDIIDEVHQKEKEMFFNLLREDFLKTLNPEYS